VPVQVKDSGGVNSLSGVQAIATGGAHTCALLNGGVQCWGSNSNGQLGNNSTSESRVPVEVKDSGGVNSLSGVQAIVAGGYYACALVNGGVQCWGAASNGQLGNNSTSESHVPMQVKDSGGVNSLSGVQAIAAHYYHACALLNGGDVQCWGYNAYGQLGNNSTSDSPVPVQVSPWAP
jgi:hypothetical protein